MNTLPKPFEHSYKIDPKYATSVAYFSMEFAIDQALKIYSGGLGFLAGSHMRSAHDLGQNLIGIGVLWKRGYYDQIRNDEGYMQAAFYDKYYHFLQDTGIKFTIRIHNHEVWVKGLYLPAETFGSAPMFFVSTDCPENDYLAQSTTFRLYDSDPQAKIAQCMVLGIGGAKLLDIMGYEPEVYHLNEAHGLSAAFYLYEKFKDIKEVQKRLVFTTHTPEEAGNEKHAYHQLHSLNFFGNLSIAEVQELVDQPGYIFNHTLAALRLCRKANGVSKLHGQVARDMWAPFGNIPHIDHVTNAQNRKYWMDKELSEAFERNDLTAFSSRKKQLKKHLFEIVADQTGKLFDPNVLTIVWARRFAGYKRADLIARDVDRLIQLLDNNDKPVQLIFAGKPYPTDYGAINVFNHLVHLSKNISRMAVLYGYELKLSRHLKEGADIWLNTPRVTREASGTSGMTAAMNGALNCSTNDGWIRELPKHAQTGFILPIVDHNLPIDEQDAKDYENLINIIKDKIVPLYYQNSNKWDQMVQKSIENTLPFFDSDRMADEYYTKIYTF